MAGTSTFAVYFCFVSWSQQIDFLWFSWVLVEPEDQQEQLECQLRCLLSPAQLSRKWLPALGAGNPVALENRNELPPSRLCVSLLSVIGVFWSVYVKVLSLGALQPALEYRFIYVLPRTIFPPPHPLPPGSAKCKRLSWAFPHLHPPSLPSSLPLSLARGKTAWPTLLVEGVKSCSPGD